MVTGRGIPGQLHIYVVRSSQNMDRASHTLSKFAKDLQILLGTIVNTIRGDPVLVDGQSKPRCERPVKHTAWDRRRILYVIQKVQRVFYVKIRLETDLGLSDPTVYCILQDFNMGHWIAKKRPLLDADHAKAHLRWCLDCRDWTLEQWLKAIFIDECSLERGLRQWLSTRIEELR